MIRAVPVGILRQVLLVIVGPEDGFPTRLRALWRGKYQVGRLSVDFAVNPAVDHDDVSFGQCPTLTPSGPL